MKYNYFMSCLINESVTNEPINEPSQKQMSRIPLTIVEAWRRTAELYNLSWLNYVKIRYDGQISVHCVQTGEVLSFQEGEIIDVDFGYNHELPKKESYRMIHIDPQSQLDSDIISAYEKLLDRQYMCDYQHVVKNYQKKTAATYVCDREGGSITIPEVPEWYEHMKTFR